MIMYIELTTLERNLIKLSLEDSLRKSKEENVINAMSKDDQILVLSYIPVITNLLEKLKQ